MKRTHWIRLALCGFVAGVIWNLLSVVFLAIVAPDFVASVQRSAPHPAQGGAFFFANDVLMGVWAVWLYSAIAPRYGGKLTTAAIAGVAWWILKTLQSAKWAGIRFVALGQALASSDRVVSPHKAAWRAISWTKLDMDGYEEADWSAPGCDSGPRAVLDDRRILGTVGT